MTEDNFGALTLKYRRKEITAKGFAEQVEKNKDNPEFFCMKAEEDNGNCPTLPYHPETHPKGILYQKVIKKAMIKAIDFAHELFVKDYDKNGFIFDDTRLKRINAFSREYLENNISHYEEEKYKRDFMNKLLDIIFSIVKYDRYYAPRFFDFINKFKKEFPEEFELLPYEKEMLGYAK